MSPSGGGFVFSRVTGDREVAEMLRQSGSVVNRGAREVLVDIGRDLVERVRLSAGRFTARTGLLQRSVKMKLFEGSKGMRVYVSPDATRRTPGRKPYRYGFALEVGSKKNQVMRKAHVRKAAAGTRLGTASSSRTRVSAHLEAQGVQFVKEHPMKVNLAPHPFVAPVATGMESGIRTRISAAIGAAMEGLRA